MVTQANLARGNAGSGASANTASIAPGANKLIIVAVHSGHGGGAANVPSISGCGMTWVQIANIKANSNTWGTTLFRGMSASPSSGALTIDFGGQNQDAGIMWFVEEFSGVKTTGANGADAVVQSATGKTSGTNTGLTITLGAFAKTNNATYGTAVCQTTITAGSGFTQLGTKGAAYAGSQDQWKNSADTTVDWSWGSNGNENPGIAIEIAVGAEGGFFLAAQ